MDLARALTTRKQKRPGLSQALSMGRVVSLKQSNASPVPRTQISSPVELLSTTNMLSYNAPDIDGTQRIRHASLSTSSSTSSVRSPSDDSDHMPSLKEDTSEASEGDSSPPSPEPNHPSCYFKVPASGSSYLPSGNAFANHAKSASVDTLSPSIPQRAPSHSKRASIDTNSPCVPQRAPSHSMRAHVDLARKRSLKQAPDRDIPSLRRSQSREFTPSPPAAAAPDQCHPAMRRSASVASLRSDEVAVAAARSAYIRHAATSATKSRKREAQSFEQPPALDAGLLAAANPFGMEIAQLQSVAEEFTGAVCDAAVEEDLMHMRRAGLLRLDVADYLAEIGACYGAKWDAETARGDATVEVGWI